MNDGPVGFPILDVVVTVFEHEAREMDSFSVHVFGVWEVAVVTGGERVRGVSVEAHECCILDYLGACPARNNPARFGHKFRNISFSFFGQKLKEKLTTQKCCRGQGHRAESGGTVVPS